MTETPIPVCIIRSKPIAAAVNDYVCLCRFSVTLRNYLQGIIVTLHYGEALIEDTEMEWRRALIGGAVVNYALGRLGDRLWGQQKQYQHNSQRRNGILQVTTVTLEVDSIEHWHRPHLDGLLLYCRLEELGVCG